MGYKTILSTIWIVIIALIFYSMDNSTVRKILGTSQDLSKDLTTLIVDDSTTHSILNVTETILNLAKSSTVEDRMVYSIKNNMSYSGVLYSLKFENITHTIIVDVKPSILKVYTLKDTFFGSDDVVHLEQYLECYSAYATDIPYSSLKELLDIEIEIIENYFRKEISERMALDLIKFKFPDYYGSTMKRTQPPG